MEIGKLENRQAIMTENSTGNKRKTIFLFILVLLGGCCLWFYQAQEQQQRRQIENQLMSIAQLKIQDIARWRTKLQDDAEVLSASPLLGKGVAQFIAHPDAEGAEDLLRHFRSLREHYRYTDILLVDPRGQMRLGLHPDANNEKDAGYGEALVSALRERRTVLTDLYQDRNGKPRLSVIAPLFSGAGKEASVLGAIILNCDPGQFLYPLIQSWPTRSETAETLLVRRDGNDVLYLNDIRHQAGAALKLRIPLTRTDLPAARAVLGDKGIFEGWDYRGIKVLSVILPVPDSPWFMVAKIDDREAFASWRFLSILISLACAALLALIAAVGLVLRQQDKKVHYQKLYETESRLRTAVERHSIILRGVGDGIIATDATGKIELLNPVAEALTGWSDQEAQGRPLSEVFHIINEQTRQEVENPVEKVLRTGYTVMLANHTLLIARDGQEIPIADSGAPVADEDGKISGVVLVFRDQSEERFAHRLIQLRLQLIDYASTHSLSELLTKAIDDVCQLVDSPIGFFHFVEPDQKTIVLQQWSTRTLKEFCQSEGKGMHYGIEQAGVWADCIRQKRPVIHNDYMSLAEKKGLPQGHAEVVRELVVPVIYQDKVVAVLGVGNKPDNYTERDVETVTFLADIAWHIVVKKRAEMALEENIAFTWAVLDNLPVGIAVNSVDPGVTFHYMNENFPKFYRTTREKLAEPDGFWQSVYEDPAFREDMKKRVLDDCASGDPERMQWVDVPITRTGEGTTYISARNIQIPDKPLVISTVWDVTERKLAESAQERLQEQFIQAQKMESVGRLAGGVAHDFNNMLSVILGNVEIALDRVEPQQEIHEDLNEIRSAALRSADLTRQLLAFARRQTVSPKILDLNDTIEGMLRMLKRLIGEDIDLTWLPAPGVWPVMIDPAQIDQILANLCVNARDAIDDVGKITIETGNTIFNESYCADHLGFIMGEYALLALSDDGSGIARETLMHIFEPFFTTKRPGEGTGLGLATVYGIVKQNNGFINVYSEPGRGTTFKIYLPRFQGEVVEVKREEVLEIPQAKGETVLIVEDEPSILAMGKRMLESLGYTVLVAHSPDEALGEAAGRQGAIHLLLTDVVMPEMNGRELAERLMALEPELQCLFMSGYTANVIARHGVLKEGVQFIQKPFSKKDLAVKVRQVLDGR
jgi:PAS domain S-box-containing protein